MSTGRMTDEEAVRTAGRRAALLILALPLAMAACGKKGPLRLPKEAPAGTPPPAPDAGSTEDEAK